jgi:hypothetical protein
VLDQDEATADLLAVQEEFASLVARARQGDLEVLPALRQYLDCNQEIWLQAGDIARHARESWISLITGQDLATKEVIARKADALRAELAGPDPTPLERLLVDRIVACWLQVHHADAMVAQAGDVSLRQADFARKRQNSAHRCYLTAIGALVSVRRLLPRMVEIPAEVALPADSHAAPVGAGDRTETNLMCSEPGVCAGGHDGPVAGQAELLRLVPMVHVAVRAG